MLYVATATASDAEMAYRIRLHQARRPADWRTLEEPFAPASAIDPACRTIVLEDLTLLLSNLLLRHVPARELTQQDADDAEAHTLDQLRVLTSAQQHLVVVSNEVGMGLVPPYPLGRLFRDALGRVNQQAATLCSEAYLLVAGIPLPLK